MRRRKLLRNGGWLGAVACAGCLKRSEEPLFREGFEDGIGDWEARAAIGPEVDVDVYEWELGVSDVEAAEGEHSLRIWNEGTYDDGVTWGVHPIVVDSETDRISVTAQFWSESESFNTLRDAVMRLGSEPPSAEEDFPNPGVNTTALGVTASGGLREPLWLEEGWREYAFEWTRPTANGGTLYLAVGTTVIWEGDATHYVDDIVVETR